jgi:hypothetical protein
MKKIMICCSANFYDKVKEISDYLLKQKYEIVYPNGYDEIRNYGNTLQEKSDVKKSLYLESREKIKTVDEIIVLNYNKTKNNVVFKNYIGPATFLEMYETFIENKIIYLLNEMPDESNIFYDDIKIMMPKLLHGNIKNIKQ